MLLFRETFFRRACVAICLCFASQLAGADEWKPWKGGKRPPLALNDLQGNARSLDQFKGKVLVVNFWATWCEPCIEEMPSLQRFRDRAPSGKVEVIGVNLGEGEARIKGFTERTGVSFPVLLDRDGIAKKDWKVNGVPATFVIDGRGRIRYTYVGVLDFDDKEVAARVLRLIPTKQTR